MYFVCTWWIFFLHSLDAWQNDTKVFYSILSQQHENEMKHFKHWLPWDKIMTNKPLHSTINNISHYSSAKSNFSHNNRVQRKSFLQLAIRASWSQHLLAQTSLQLAPKTFWLAELISWFFCYSNSSKNITCPSGKIKTEFTSPIAKSTSPGPSDTTFFAYCNNFANHNQGAPNYRFL